uniref:MIF4G domain-containing protein n=1 Tax=Glossina brevipalpis TaxID=37001 RepID=A0A1A9X4B9_9MUSC
MDGHLPFTICVQQINQHPNLNHHEQQQQQHYNFNKYYQDNRGYKQHNNQRFYNCDHQTQQQQQLRHHPGMHHTINVESNSSEYANDMENIALDYLQSVIQSLNKNSGRFDTIATRFFSVFEGMENNTFVLSNAIEEVFNESMKNPNFRYMGAKIYNLLHKLNPRKDSLFYTLLRYKLDFHQNELKENINMNQQSKVRETALFLAELYMQLREEELRIQFIAEKIICSLKQLLSKENVDNVRCICMTLKLAGYDLTTDCPEGIEEIITDLNAIDDRSPEKYPLVSIVVSLQKNNWGRKVCRPESPIEINKDIDSIRCSDDPVFYGPDGSIITDEECDFLTISANNISDSTDNVDIDNDSEVDLDPEMDEETESAYKEFIKQNAKSS